MVHQPSGGFQGQASDILRHAEDIMKIKRRLNEIYVHHTGRDYDTIERTLDRDHFMTAEEARDFGLVDRVETKRAEEPRRREVVRPSRVPGQALICNRVGACIANRAGRSRPDRRGDEHDNRRVFARGSLATFC